FNADEKIRIEAVVATLERVSPEPIEVLYMTTLTKGGRPYAESLYAFSENYVLEAKEWRSRFDYDLAWFNDTIRYLHVTAEDFEVGNATEKSQLSIQLTLLEGLSVPLAAIGKRCNILWDLLESRLKKATASVK